MVKKNNLYLEVNLINVAIVIIINLRNSNVDVKELVIVA